MIERLLAKDTIIGVDHAHYQLALEAQRDTQTLAFVFEQAHHYEDSAEFQQLLRKVIFDSELPDAERARSAGPDTQFHLYVAAVCAKAGLKPAFEEPDLRCVLNGKPISIAVKRIKNMARLQDRIREAAEQIDRQKVPGIIAIDVTMAANRRNIRPQAVGMEDIFALHLQRNTHRYIEKHYDRFWGWLRGSLVRGIELHASYVTDASRGPCAHLGFNYGFPTIKFNRSRSKEYYAFHQKYSCGIPNRQHW